MKYFIALTYCGHIQHSWVYDVSDFSSALDQFRKLTECFSEVNEVQVLMLKVSSHYNRDVLKDILYQAYVDLI